jgi:GTPase SAR1 family protein
MKAINLTAVLLFLITTSSFSQKLTGSLLKKFSINNGTKDTTLIVPNQTQLKLRGISNRSISETYSDSQGNFVFDSVPSGKYFLHITDEKVKKKVVYVEVSKGELHILKPITVDRINNTIKVKKQ